METRMQGNSCISRCSKFQPIASKMFTTTVLFRRSTASESPIGIGNVNKSVVNLLHVYYYNYTLSTVSTTTE